MNSNENLYNINIGALSINNSKVNLFVTGSIVGAVLVVVAGLSMGWLVTSGGANGQATAMSETAVKDQLVPICMHQFNNQADSVGKLEALRGLGTYKREEFLTSQGLANMPGSDSAVRGVARECAARLLEAKI